MAILGLDFGEKRIGVALADADGLVAIPLTVVERASEEADASGIAALSRQYGAERIVVGLPLSLDGSIGNQAETVLAFARTLSESIDVPVDTWDERYSTVAAESMLLETGMKSRKRKGRRDALAAAIILQSYLDSNKLPRD